MSTSELSIHEKYAKVERRRQTQEEVRQRARDRDRQRRVLARHTTKGILCVAHKPDPVALADAIAAIPADTRSVTGMICGDPLPGRSALDRRTG